MEGQIVKILSNLYFVESGDKVYPCHSRGRFRKDNITPVVGDFCLFDEKENYILEILPRKNVLVRPLVANIDQAFIITSVKEPDFQDYLLDKLLVVMYHYDIEPIICITKYDLLNEEEKENIDSILNYYKSIGYTVVKNDEIDKIKKMFKGKTTVFTGQTGAGKSTLLNKIEPSLCLQTGEISHALGRGKHTTRHVELIHLYGGNVLDTPGFSSLDLKDVTKEEIESAFIEFKKVNCPYSDCLHIKEKECLVKELVQSKEILESRYINYKRFIEEK